MSSNFQPKIGRIWSANSADESTQLRKGSVSFLDFFNHPVVSISNLLVFNWKEKKFP